MSSLADMPYKKENVFFCNAGIQFSKHVVAVFDKYHIALAVAS